MRAAGVALLRSSQESARGGNTTAPLVCACGAHMRVSGGGTSLYTSSLILTTLTAQRFTPQFADEKLSWGLDERPVSDRPGFQPASGPSWLLRPPEELDTADGRPAFRPVCLTRSGHPLWVLSCRGTRG